MTETEKTTGSRKLSHYVQSTTKKQVDVGIYLETQNDEDDGRLDVKNSNEKKGRASAVIKPFKLETPKFT